LRPGIDLTLEHTRDTAAGAASTSNAISLALPLGPLRLLTRYQAGSRLSFPDPSPLGWSETQSREVQASAAYFLNPRVSFDYQVSTRWQQDGPRGSWDQLQ